MMDFILALLLAIVLALCLSLLLFQAITGVPPLSATRVEAANAVALLRQAGLPEQAIVYDLGSGWGALVMALARAFPQARIIGVERSPLPCWIAGLRTRRLPNVRVWRHACRGARLLVPRSRAEGHAGEWRAARRGALPLAGEPAAATGCFF